MIYFDRHFISILTFLAAVFAVGPAYSLEQFKEFKRDHWEWELGASYFSSEANYDSSGNKQNLLSGNSYSLADFNLGTRYVPDRQWAVFAIGNIGLAQAKSSVATRTNSSLNWAVLGAEFMLYSGFVDLVPEFALLIPFEKVDGKADSSLNSEGVVEGRGRFTLQKDFGSWRGFSYLGMTFRSDERSFLLPWGVGLLTKGSTVILGAEVSGSQSISDDKDKKDPTLRNAYLNTVNAGSFAFYSVNPSVMNATVSATLPLSARWSLKGYGGMTVAGTNSAAGFQVGGVLRYTLDMTEGYVQEPDYEPISSPIPQGKSNLYFDKPDREVHGFQEDTDDGVDQTLFQPPKKKPRLNKSQLQKQLDQTEFDIELKSQKRKKGR